MIILGIDPGTATTGYGVIESSGNKCMLIDYGVITTPSDAPMEQRLCMINNKIEQLIIQYSPEVMAIEQIFYHKNAKTVISVAQSRGVAVFTGASNGLQVCEYTPLQVKKAVVGYGTADKRQVQLLVQKILVMKEMPKPDDAADALAIAICHAHSWRLQNLLGGSK
ncbi:MAG: crossover junction endodeoxyribonuclease RuvC [Syntrophomonadaceae bacterium]|nr:crossover junction endodeoxyribonuclease RuvC [Syntrophomonadaceae bacterium]